MRLAVFDDNRVGLVEGTEVCDVSSVVTSVGEWPPTFISSLIADWDDKQRHLQMVRREGRRLDLSAVQLKAPNPAPTHIVAAPSNYRRHITEMKRFHGLGKSMNELGFFLKPTSSLSGPTDPIVLPKGSRRVFHHECELAVVLGRQCKNASANEALASVFGYTCLMDITMRADGEMNEERVTRKAFDTFTPLGPWIVTADEVGDPQTLGMALFVNGELRQEATTADMVVSVAEQIAYISSVMTLYPGDIIATGTPEGVDVVRPGDTVRIEIERIGGFEVRVEEALEFAPRRF